MNGMMYRKSRYLTLSAVIHNPGPRLARKAIATQNGKVRICQTGKNWYHSMRPIRMVKLIRKSTNDTTMAAVGTIRRGKYTLLMRLALLMRLLEAPVNEVEKSCQGHFAENDCEDDHGQQRLD